jgi:hypothetical protein
MTRSIFKEQVFIGKTAANLGAIPPQSNDGTLVNGSIIDRRGYRSGKLVFERAVVTGAPSAAALSLIIQHGNESNLSDAATYATLETALDILLAGQKDYLLNLAGAKRYVRVVMDTTYTGGTTPANVVAAQLVLGDRDVNPVAAETVYP